MARRDHEADIRRLSSEYRMAAQAIGIALLDYPQVTSLDLPAQLEADVEALRQRKARLDAARAEYERLYA